MRAKWQCAPPVGAPRQGQPSSYLAEGPGLANEGAPREQERSLQRNGQHHRATGQLSNVTTRHWGSCNMGITNIIGFDK